MVEEDQSQIKVSKGRSPWISAGLLTLWPLPITVAIYIISPAWIVPVFNHPIGKMFFVGAFALMMIGWVLARFCKNNVLRFLVLLAFPCPAVLVPLLGMPVISIPPPLPSIMEQTRYNR